MPPARAQSTLSDVASLQFQHSKTVEVWPMMAIEMAAAMALGGLGLISVSDAGCDSESIPSQMRKTPSKYSKQALRTVRHPKWQSEHARSRHAPGFCINFIPIGDLK